MLTTLAEGRGCDDTEDKDRRKGPEIVCDLSLDKVHAAITMRIDKAEDTDAGSKFVINAAQQAAKISQLDDLELPRDVEIRSIVSKQQQVPPIVKPAKEMDL